MPYKDLELRSRRRIGCGTFLPIDPRPFRQVVACDISAFAPALGYSLRCLVVVGWSLSCKERPIGRDCQEQSSLRSVEGSGGK